MKNLLTYLEKKGSENIQETSQKAGQENCPGRVTLPSCFFPLGGLPQPGLLAKSVLLRRRCQRQLPKMWRIAEEASTASIPSIRWRVHQLWLDSVQNHDLQNTSADNSLQWDIRLCWAVVHCLQNPFSRQKERTFGCKTWDRGRKATKQNHLHTLRWERECLLQNCWGSTFSLWEH